MLDNFIVGIRQALIPNQTTPQQLSQNRQMLAKQTQDCSQPFGRAVYNINGSIGTYGVDIPSWKARQYALDSTDIENGNRSNTSAFISSSLDWAKMENLEGAIMNFFWCNFCWGKR